MRERLQKFLARCGVASRRSAENFITQGRVSVNGATVTVLGTKVDPTCDKVVLDGALVAPRTALTYLALHKPPGYLTTRHDPHGRRTIYALLPAEYAHLVPVGRLDNQSEGLLFLTDDGAWAHRVAHPRYSGEKEYAVLINGELTSQQLDSLRAPMILDSYRLNPVTVQIGERAGNNTWVTMILTEGRKRQIRYMLATIGKRAVRLVRVRIGPVRLGDLASGKHRPLARAEVDHWREGPAHQGPEQSAQPTKPRAGTRESTAVADQECAAERAAPATNERSSSDQY